MVGRLFLSTNSEQNRLRNDSLIVLKLVVNELDLAQHGKRVVLFVQKILPKLLHSLSKFFMFTLISE
jgi:hypothetical protein